MPSVVKLVSCKYQNSDPGASRELTLRAPMSYFMMGHVHGSYYLTDYLNSRLDSK